MGMAGHLLSGVIGATEKAMASDASSSPPVDSATTIREWFPGLNDVTSTLNVPFTSPEPQDTESISNAWGATFSICLLTAIFNSEAAVVRAQERGYDTLLGRTGNGQRHASAIRLTLAAHSKAYSIQTMSTLREVM